MLRTQIYLPEEQLKMLKTIAWRENISLSETIRRALDEKLIEYKRKVKIDKKKNVGDWLISLAKNAERLKIKGPKDLASNLDKYLYGRK